MNTISNRLFYSHLKFKGLQLKDFTNIEISQDMISRFRNAFMYNSSPILSLKENYADVYIMLSRELLGLLITDSIVLDPQNPGPCIQALIGSDTSISDENIKTLIYTLHGHLISNNEFPFELKKSIVNLVSKCKSISMRTTIGES